MSTLILAAGILHGGRGCWRAEARGVRVDDGLLHALRVDVRHGVSWCQKGVPSTGVLGWADSCAVMAPAR